MPDVVELSCLLYAGNAALTFVSRGVRVHVRSVPLSETKVWHLSFTRGSRGSCTRQALPPPPNSVGAGIQYARLCERETIAEWRRVTLEGCAQKGGGRGVSQLEIIHTIVTVQVIQTSTTHAFSTTTSHAHR